MGELIEKKGCSDHLMANAKIESIAKRAVNGNLLIKKQMAQELLTLGLSKNAVARILHLRSEH